MDIYTIDPKNVPPANMTHEEHRRSTHFAIIIVIIAAVVGFIYWRINSQIERVVAPEPATQTAVDESQAVAATLRPAAESVDTKAVSSILRKPKTITANSVETSSLLSP